MPKIEWRPSGSSLTPYGESFQASAELAAEALLPGFEAAARGAARAAVDFPAPLVEIAPNTWVLELFHGPSCAFKDVGARFMAELSVQMAGEGAESGVGGPTGGRGGADGAWEKEDGAASGAVCRPAVESSPPPRPAGRPSQCRSRALRGRESGSAGRGEARSGLDRSRRTVLAATSGDTGGAVAAAFGGLDGYRVVPLFPLSGISERQRRQMTTLGESVTAVAVRGIFDDCQALAKAAFADRELSAACRLTSANSINVGRLLPQLFYYAHAAGALERRAASADRAFTPPRFVVPSGNLGNLCAGLLAHLAGVPASGFVAACNANDAFPRYMAEGGASGVPGGGARSQPTLSSAMDVAAPSNLERIRALMDREALGRLVTAESVSDEETAECMGRTWSEAGYLLDPHTAVGIRAHERAPADPPTVILATAHPAKFPEAVLAAAGVEPELPPSLALALGREERWTEIEPELGELARVLAG